MKPNTRVCENCQRVGEFQRYIEQYQPAPGWHLLSSLDETGIHGEWADLCSLDCLTEFAWTMRERRPKLSKSRQ